MPKDSKGHGSNPRGMNAQGMRLQKTYQNQAGTHQAKVYSNPEWGEHVVKFVENGVYNAKADYHTDDKQDAHDTAQYALRRYDAGLATRGGGSGTAGMMAGMKSKLSDDVAAGHTLASGPKSAPAPIHDAHRYNPVAVDKAIASSNRAGRRIGGKEAKMIHALLKGRH